MLNVGVVKIMLWRIPGKKHIRSRLPSVVFFFHSYVQYRWTVFSRVILVETITDGILTLAVVSPLLEQQANYPWRTFHQTDTQRHLQVTSSLGINRECHDDVIKWKHFPRNWPFVRGIHRSPVNSPHKGQGRRALIFSLNCAWINYWVNNREAGDLRRHRAHYDVIVM